MLLKYVLPNDLLKTEYENMFFYCKMFQLSIYGRNNFVIKYNAVLYNFVNVKKAVLCCKQGIGQIDMQVVNSIERPNQYPDIDL